MPIIYLSPSTQEGNFYVNGGTEEEWMNRLADAMEPYLKSSGIQYVQSVWRDLVSPATLSMSQVAMDRWFGQVRPMSRTEEDNGLERC